MNLNLHALPLIVALGLSLDKHTANVIRKLFSFACPINSQAKIFRIM